MTNTLLENNINQIAPPGGAPVSGQTSPVTIPASPNLNTENGQRKVYHIDKETITSIQKKLQDEIDSIGGHLQCIKELIVKDRLQNIKWAHGMVCLAVLLTIVVIVVTLTTGPFGLFGMLGVAGVFSGGLYLEEHLHGAKRKEHLGIHERLNIDLRIKNMQQGLLNQATNLWDVNYESKEKGNFQSYVKTFNQFPLNADRLIILGHFFNTQLSIEKMERELDLYKNVRVDSKVLERINQDIKTRRKQLDEQSGWEQHLKDHSALPEAVTQRIKTHFQPDPYIMVCDRREKLINPI